VGKIFVIKGTEVSFYIPPTGVTVVKTDVDTHSNVSPEGLGFVRNALTLEQLEYCILIDENGSKRYEHGPQVVFPQPTEKFLSDKHGNTKSRAIELNSIQGIHIKVIEDYTEDDGTERKKGDELFIKGDEVQIYFPREEHSLISYDGRSKHFATAIPTGEGRYVMNRLTGEIRTAKGPDMLLPDPREEVIVRRALSDKQCALWYPSNQEALDYNRALREVVQSAPTTRSGAVSEGDFERSAKSKRGGGRKSAIMSANLMEKSIHGDGGGALRGDEFTRSASYTQPRTVTLNTKYQGVPAIDIWTGYAIMVVSKTGKRRVVEGPTTVLLDYDEALTVVELSTGKPKSTDDLLKTTYLKVKNNKVSDLITVETSDHVKVSVKVSYRCHFGAATDEEKAAETDADRQKWFDVVNYIKFFTDHIRSILKAAGKQTKIADLYADSTGFIRDNVLGVKTDGTGRPGLTFDEIGLKITDVEVLDVVIDDGRIQSLLDNAQHSVVKGNIDNEQARHSLALSRERHAMEIDLQRLKTNTRKEVEALQAEVVAAELVTALAKIDGEVQRAVKQNDAIQAKLANTDFEHQSKLDRDAASAKQRHEFENLAQSAKMSMLKAETEAVVTRFAAAQDGFTEGLLSLSNTEVVAKVAESLSVQNLIGGKNFTDVVTKVFEGSKLEGTMKEITDKLKQTNNGTKRGSKREAPSQPQA
jgi:major vault protein